MLSEQCNLSEKTTLMTFLKIRNFSCRIKYSSSLLCPTRYLTDGSSLPGRRPSSPYTFHIWSAKYNTRGQLSREIGDTLYNKPPNKHKNLVHKTRNLTCESKKPDYPTCMNNKAWVHQIPAVILLSSETLNTLSKQKFTKRDDEKKQKIKEKDSIGSS